ncbi:hypothetical protein BC940DRAFT_298786 [Gongronella butleri]|nr:hypothetical protein BC940DRAFT_298786 [Gongronella butleri]
MRVHPAILRFWFQFCCRWMVGGLGSALSSCCLQCFLEFIFFRGENKDGVVLSVSCHFSMSFLSLLYARTVMLVRF